jgi:hypothetical protein
VKLSKSAAKALEEIVLLIREFIAIKFIELAMLFAPKEMELAIAKGICLTFAPLRKKLEHELSEQFKREME